MESVDGGLSQRPYSHPVYRGQEHPIVVSRIGRIVALMPRMNRLYLKSTR